MVRAALAALAISAAAAEAGAADWRDAGGALFVGEGPPQLEYVPSPAEAQTPRIAPPSQPFADAVSLAAERHGLDPKLLHALVVVESAYRPDAVSHAGAGGLTQLMPATAAELGVRDRFDPVENLIGGADYLAQQVLRFGDIRLALAAYNAGPSRVARLGRIPDIAETRAYVSAVVDCYLALAAGRGVRSARECRAPEHGP
ncbi:lytic transglycosylase domain-containing protein [Phenylobacterium terrae]|uniref:Lytic transglycosylase domain-containing protein n=1 Tax=Phenylobacterium terrae TaxID=2665495 RepID=A0ABW4N7K6_9CAUL